MDQMINIYIKIKEALEYESDYLIEILFWEQVFLRQTAEMSWRRKTCLTNKHSTDVAHL